ncbi:MAG: hypothetical protein P4M15_00685 [Alphaproteobacteria bacterium]|nr:hypothetical protein [Alphaproteobacteria bacterium]
MHAETEIYRQKLQGVVSRIKSVIAENNVQIAKAVDEGISELRTHPKGTAFAFISFGHFVDVSTDNDKARYLVEALKRGYGSQDLLSSDALRPLFVRAMAELGARVECKYLDGNETSPFDVGIVSRDKGRGGNEGVLVKLIL